MQEQSFEEFTSSQAAAVLASSVPHEQSDSEGEHQLKVGEALLTGWHEHVSTARSEKAGQQQQDGPAPKKVKGAKVPGPDSFFPGTGYRPESRVPLCVFTAGCREGGGRFAAPEPRR
jgi:hypothetical protein